jgi:hypothetical protein
MGHIFISFADEDYEFAEILIHQLKNSGLLVWEDYRMHQSQTNWYPEVEQAIRSASVIIIVMSPVAKESESVTYEWIFALGTGMPIILVQWKEVSLHPRLALLSCFDLTHTSPAWDVLLATVQQTV